MSRLADPPKAAYVHIPFCKSKCAYCDFNSYPGMESLWPAYAEALESEIRAARMGRTTPLESVYFGGGTPTLLPSAYLLRLLDAIAETFGLTADAEISIEANPGTVNPKSLQALRAGGFNRLSLGVQSFNDDLLRNVGRIHTAEEAVSAYEDVRDSGFHNIGIDLIYAVPGEDLATWEADLRGLIRLRPEHASLYELTIAEGTPLGEEVRSGSLVPLDADTQLDMLQMGLSLLAEAGYSRYEVSNYAGPGFECRHNQTYWRYEDYYGFGAGACSFRGGVRRRNVSSPSEYVTCLSSGASGVEWSETPNDRQKVAEVLMLAMRTAEGLDLQRFAQRFGYALEDAYQRELTTLQAHGWLALAGGRLRPTEQGMLLADEIAAEFL